jgi:predicted transcriptional regulator
MAELAQTGFGEVHVPTLIVLDPTGKIAFRKEGIVKGDEIHRAIDSAATPHP